jgi:uncharacterized delta-60 repeat protein
MKTLLKFIICLTITTAVTITAHAQVGSLDLSFSTDGKTTTAIGSTSDYSYSVAIQNDGKIVVAGSSDNGISHQYALIRYNTDGTLDSTFDSDGIVTTVIGNSSHGYAIAIQSDGKILVAGDSYNGSNFDFALARYNTNGLLDNTFNSDGIVTTDFVNSEEAGYSIAIQSDGKIVVAGYNYNGGTDFALVRYDSNGALDNTFDSDGKVTTDIGNMTTEAGVSVAIQSDGKILLAGSSATGSNTDFALVRYNIDGTLDNTFDLDGKKITDFGSNNDFARSVAIQNDGKIVLAGNTFNGIDNDFALVRYNADGTLDNAFDSDGKTTTDFGGATEDGYAICIQSDGKIILAGENNIGGSADFTLVRYNNNGTVDTNFDTDGKAVTDFIGFSDAGRSAALQSDGKIVVVGYSNNGANGDIAIARYNTGVNVGIAESNELSGVSIYPNPANNNLTISYDDQLLFDVVCLADITGRKIIEKGLDEVNSIQINIEEIPSGLYFIELKKENKKVYKKKLVIIKQ